MYKVGDEVTIFSYYNSDRKYNSDSRMQKMVGNKYKIQETFVGDKTKYKINGYYWDIQDLHDFKNEPEKTFETKFFDIKNLDV